MRKLLELLSDGNFHSGEELGEKLSISRAAVWKAIKKLQALGMDIRSIRSRGYQLSEAIELLNENSIYQHLNSNTQEQLSKIILFDSIDSTNRYLLQLDEVHSGDVCLAEQQTAGRGRFGRTWISPFAANIYLSLCWEFPEGSTQLIGLSLVMGMAVIKALHQLGVADLSLKWPNDIIHQQKKLAGILIDMTGDANGPCRVIIGIGVNVKMPSTVNHLLEQAWTDLTTIINQSLSRNKIIAFILNELFQTLPVFQENGLTAFQNEWLAVDALYGKQVVLKSAHNDIHGEACGIDERGYLLIKHDDEEQAFSAGEVSVRALEMEDK